MASFFSVDFKPQNVAKMCQKRVPVGRQIEPKIDKSRNNRVLKTHLKPIPQKTSKISDFGRLRDLPNRAETLARTAFSQIHLITKTCSKLTKKGGQKHEKGQKLSPPFGGRFRYFCDLACCLFFSCFSGGHFSTLFVILVSSGLPK